MLFVSCHSFTLPPSTKLSTNTSRPPHQGPLPTHTSMLGRVPRAVLDVQTHILTLLCRVRGHWHSMCSLWAYTERSCIECRVYVGGALIGAWVVFMQQRPVHRTPAALPWRHSTGRSREGPSQALRLLVSPHEQAPHAHAQNAHTPATN